MIGINYEKAFANRRDSGDEMLTVAEVATRLRLKPSWVYTHADALGAYRLGKYIRFSWRKVLDRIDRNSVGSQPNDLSEPQ